MSHVPLTQLVFLASLAVSGMLMTGGNLAHADELFCSEEDVAQVDGTAERRSSQSALKTKLVIRPTYTDMPAQ